MKWVEQRVRELMRIILIGVGTSNLLPAADHAYGKPNAIDTENAKRITSSWLEHVPSKKRADSSSVDFVRLNGSVSAIPKVSPEVCDDSLSLRLS